MHNSLKLNLYIKILFIYSITCLHFVTLSNRKITYFPIRSQATDSARDIVSWAHKTHIFDMEKLYGVFGVTPELSLSFNTQSLIQCLLPLDASNRAVIRGSNSSYRNPTDWLADYFFLPPDYHSIVSFDPHITNALINLSLFLGLDEFKNGVYIHIASPLVYTRWHLDTHEVVHNIGTLPYPKGYFSSEQINRNDLFAHFKDYITGKNLSLANQQESYVPLHNALWSNKPLTKTKLAAITIALGKNNVLEENYHFGLNICFSIPTGNRPQGTYLFEPIVGNGHHWEFGLGCTGHYTLWRSLDYEKEIAFYLDANMTHLFETTQIRTFDLHNSPASRYMITQKMEAPVIDLAILLDNNTIQPSSQFKQIYTSVANITTVPIHVSIPLQIDMSLMLNIICDTLSLDIGYNLWYRSCEQITIKNNISTFGSWALKGDNYVYGFTQNATSIALSATQSHATIYTGLNRKSDSVSNSAADNAHDAYTTDNNALCNIPCTPQQSMPIKTSFEPVLLTINDIDICNAQTQSFTNAFFIHCSYTKRHLDDYLPYVGVGTKVEFASMNNKLKQPKQCWLCSLSQWSLWIKAGFGFR